MEEKLGPWFYVLGFMQPRLVLNSQSSLLCLLNAGITGMYDHTQL
jgi:hypothetical protein